MAENSIFELLQKHYEQELPFVAYRKPDMSHGTVYLQETAKLFTSDDLSESGFVLAPFDDKNTTFLIPEGDSKKHIFDTSGITLEDFAEQVKSVTVTSEEEKQQHISLVEEALLKLRLGELQKVVLSRKEIVNIKEENPVRLFKELLISYPTAFVYLWSHPETGCWLGATPEALLKVTGNQFKTMALAGTQQYKGTLDVDWGEKEKQEQQFVTDSIVDHLKICGVENIEISSPYTAKAGSLLHLRTDITGKIPRENSGLTAFNRSSDKVKNIISALHPTPAVCGLPKEKAKEYILSEEGYDREFYTGFLGELNINKNVQRSRTRRNVENLAYRSVRKETNLFVNLRCMKLEAGKANLFIGGGITKDSNPEAEWMETVNKAQTMKKVLLK